MYYQQPEVIFRSQNTEYDNQTKFKKYFEISLTRKSFKCSKIAISPEKAFLILRSPS